MDSPGEDPQLPGSEQLAFDTQQMRGLLDAHHVADRDWLFDVMMKSEEFNPRKIGKRVFVAPDYNQPMEEQREVTLKRLEYLLERGVFKRWLVKEADAELRKLAFQEVVAIFDHSLSVKIGTHFFLWYAPPFSPIFSRFLNFILHLIIGIDFG